MVKHPAISKSHCYTVLVMYRKSGCFWTLLRQSPQNSIINSCSKCSLSIPLCLTTFRNLPLPLVRITIRSVLAISLACTVKLSTLVCSAVTRIFRSKLKLNIFPKLKHNQHCNSASPNDQFSSLSKNRLGFRTVTPIALD